MAQVLTLTTPQSVTDYKIDIIKFDVGESKIHIVVADTQGDKITCGYSGTVASNFMIALNKANLTTNSLQKRVLDQLVVDGQLPAGTVTGSPE